MKLTVLGATGSIGDSTLQIARQTGLLIHALSGFSRLDKLFELCQEFRPQRVCVPDDKVDEFAIRLKGANLRTEVVGGEQGLMALASDKSADKVIAGIVGSAGLGSTLSAVKAGQTILLANKESLVMAGELVMQSAHECGARILPIDSEHNAIFQCLPKEAQADSRAISEPDLGIKKLWLTASGGGFLHQSYEQMQNATVAEAIKHPNWSMGQKISIDSATMMNKGLELIEACHLFGLPEDKIDIVIHPQSIIHSMVEYVDGSLLAQLGSPDMKIPIAHALAYPKRMSTQTKPLDVFELSALQFIRPDKVKFKALHLARCAIKTGTGACITLNASNEVAVSAFLGGKIRLTDIADVVEMALEDKVLSADLTRQFTDLEDILSLDEKARKRTMMHINKLTGRLP